MADYGELQCSVNVETLDRQGKVARKNTFKNIHATIGRNQHKDLILQVASERFTLKDVKILHKFIKEDRLAAFMKTIKIKVTIQPSCASDKDKLYCAKPKTFDEISPLTLQDVKNYKKDAVITSPLANGSRKNTDITPIRGTKRGLEVMREKGRKKFNSAPMALIKLGKPDPASKSNPVNKKQSSLSEISVDSDKKRLNFVGRLTEGQKRVLKTVREGFNVFFTGSAGTGKSFILKKIIGSLPPDTTVASASTGVAACQIGGVTLHSFAGIGLGDASLERCIELALRQSVAQNWKRCKVLIIDEISMVDCHLFDKLEQIARAVRKDDRPFGGIQLVLCGDFLQLPPVRRDSDAKKFCFQSDRWSECIDVSLELTDVKRQSDQVFINILQHIRVGKCPDAIYKRLMDTKQQSFEKFGIQPTRLCTHKDNAEEINQKKMGELKGEVRAYLASDSNPEYTDQMNKSLMAPEKLQLKVGAQVMLTKNLDISKGLVNGARGVVTVINPGNNGLPVVHFASGLTMAVKHETFRYRIPGGVSIRHQIPLKLAWAISIHKSQGLTLDCCEVSLSRVFEHGQAYVALSRARSLEGLRVLDMSRDCVKAHSEVLKFYIKLRRDLRINSFEES